MTIRTPVILNGKTHDVLSAGDVLAGSAVQLSSDAGNILSIGSDGGLKAGSADKWFDAAFTVGLTYAAGNPVPEVGGGWQLTPLNRLLSGQAGRYSAYVSITGGAVLLQPGNYFGTGTLMEFNVPPTRSHTVYLTTLASDGSNSSNPPRISIGVALPPFSNSDGTYRLITGPISFSLTKPSSLQLLYTPYSATWNLDSEFQFFAAPL
ncbi:hypothetical protein P3T23_004531 [Paraburkholderia sp. GAS448]|uniref:hypothetical protein n=1 Tax=Paraburkholderia sp. GAS448 TaxID=3035136 RepID=UPI003D25D861